MACIFGIHVNYDIFRHETSVNASCILTALVDVRWPSRVGRLLAAISGPKRRGFESHPYHSFYLDVE